MKKIITLVIVFSGLILADHGFCENTPPAEVRPVTDKIQLVAEPIVKKLDPNKIGAEASYDTFQGQRLGKYFPAKYFTIAQRVEIYQEPKPIDAYIMDAKKVRWVNQNQPWNTKADFRSQIAPIFTRAYGTELTMSDPRHPNEAMVRYTHDYRDIYNNQFPIFQQETRNVNYKHEQWDQNEVLFIHATKLSGLNWLINSNLGYRYSTMSAKNDGSTFSYYNIRHTYFTYFIIEPSDKLQYLAQFEYFKEKRAKATFDFRPDHYYYNAEVRIKSNDKKTIFIPRFSYSIDKYWPLYNRYSKYEMQFKVGHDFTEKFNAATTLKYNLGIRNEVDNHAPYYDAPNPINETAAWAGIENRAQYKVYKNLWVQGGLDYAAGMNMSDFDNWGLLAGLEYYAPGIIRIDVGWRGNHYYNIDDYLNSVYFRFYLFM